MKDDTYGTLPASIYLAFFASSAAITLIMSSLLVRWTVRGKRLSFKSFFLALVDGAVPFSEVMTFLAFLAVVSLPSIYDSGHIRKLLVDEVTAYLQYPLPPLAVSGWIKYKYNGLLTQRLTGFDDRDYFPSRGKEGFILTGPLRTSVFSDDLHENHSRAQRSRVIHVDTGMEW